VPPGGDGDGCGDGVVSGPCSPGVMLIG
jgi:hypothetical protein